MCATTCLRWSRTSTTCDTPVLGRRASCSRQQLSPWTRRTLGGTPCDNKLCHSSVIHTVHANTVNTFPRTPILDMLYTPRQIAVTSNNDQVLFNVAGEYCKMFKFFPSDKNIEKDPEVDEHIISKYNTSTSTHLNVRTTVYCCCLDVTKVGDTIYICKGLVVQ